MSKSIITDRNPVAITPPNRMNPAVGWRVDDFNQLIYRHGYDSYIDKSLRCPCVTESTGQAQSTCQNCMGRGWIFVDRKKTRIISQSMNNNKKFLEWSEVNRGTAKMTLRGVDKVGFMDRIILLDLVARRTEMLYTLSFNDEIIAYPIYEPIEILNIFQFISDSEKLKPLTSEDYTIDGNKIIFNQTILDNVESENLNEVGKCAITILYTYHPVYHVIEQNRELMKGRKIGTEDFSDMPINVLTKKAHYIFDSQKLGENQLDNTIYE